MAGRGPAPKGDRSRKRDTPVVEELEGGGLYGEPLPEGVLPDDEPWHPQTLRWWESIRRNPLLENEPEMGWQFLIDTALMHHRMWVTGRFELAGELRLRVAKFGATPEDRMRLKIKIAMPSDPTVAPQGEPGNIRSITDRRKRLAGA